MSQQEWDDGVHRASLLYPADQSEGCVEPCTSSDSCNIIVPAEAIARKSGDQPMQPGKIKWPTILILPGALALAWMAVSAEAPSSGQPSTKNGEWPQYTADLKGTKYSPLDQINSANFNKLEVAWRFKTDNLGTRPEYKLEGTPLMIKGVIYATA